MSPYHFIKLNDILHVFIALNLTDCIIRTKFMIHDSSLNVNQSSSHDHCQQPSFKRMNEISGSSFVIS